MRTFALILAVTSLFSGLGSTYYWFRSSQVNVDPGRTAESGDALTQTNGWITALLQSSVSAAELNKPAALLSGICVLTGSISNFIMAAFP